MALPALKFRAYVRDDTSENTYIPTQPIGPIPPVNEIQLALPFARDYDETGSNTDGKFHTYWDDTVTSQLIADFREKYVNVRTQVFVSIGGRNSQYPFWIDQHDGIQKWVTNAVESLTNIIQKYKLDGIDVYYEHINASKEDFVYAIGELIKRLKTENVITVASIAPSDALNQKFYAPLFNQFGSYIDTVACQLYNEVEPVDDPEALALRFAKEATAVYGADKLLAGYSAISKDWATVKPFVYICGVVIILGLFQASYSAVGISIWFVPSELPELTGPNSSRPARVT